MKTVRPGFTILEVMLVLVIIAVMIGLAFPSIESMYAEVRVTAAADHLRAKFAEARSHAIEEGRPYRFGVKPGESGYKMAPDSPTYWTGANANQADDDSGPAATVLEDVMPGGITFGLAAGAANGAGDSSGYVSILTFFPDGSCNDDTTIRLDLEGARSIEINVRALTGTVTAHYTAVGAP